VGRPRSFKFESPFKFVAEPLGRGVHGGRGDPRSTCPGRGAAMWVPVASLGGASFDVLPPSAVRYPGIWGEVLSRPSSQTRQVLAHSFCPHDSLKHPDT